MRRVLFKRDNFVSEIVANVAKITQLRREDIDIQQDNSETLYLETRTALQ